jgi:hypothetical protein
MVVQVIQLGERKREPEVAPSYSISDNSTGLGSYGLHHIETNTLEIPNLHSHPKVRTSTATIAGRVTELNYGR